MRLTLKLSLLAAIVCSGVAGAQDALGFIPNGPAPRFIVAISVNDAKGEALFCVQVVSQGPLDRLTLLEDREGNKRLTFGSKPSFIVPGEGFRVPFASSKWSMANGKDVAADEVAKRLLPGSIVLLSADGKPVNETYLRLFKDDTLVLLVPPEDLPIPYMPMIGSSIPIKKAAGP